MDVEIDTNNRYDNVSPNNIHMINNTKYFLNQLHISEQCELVFAEWLKDNGFTITSIGEKVSGYDIIANYNGVDVQFEVKYNSGIGKYKSAFIEVMQSEELSGLATTTSDFQIHFDETGRCRGFRTEELKKYIRDNDLSLSSTSMLTQSGKVSGQGFRVDYDAFPLIFIK